MISNFEYKILCKIDELEKNGENSFHFLYTNLQIEQLRTQLVNALIQDILTEEYKIHPSITRYLFIKSKYIDIHITGTAITGTDVRFFQSSQGLCACEEFTTDTINKNEVIRQNRKSNTLTIIALCLTTIALLINTFCQ